MAEGTQDDHLELLGASVRVPEHVVHRGFAAETVVLNLNTGRYHGLNPVAGRMLEALDQVGAIGEVAAQIATEYEQPLETIQRDLCALCADLHQRGLIELDDRPA